uniref:HSF-type DNA-binding domain-containing protein n=1 Tax=Leptocylindrus danicus TaxID=163516 RepID=A0A7S2KH62_9STRA|mmetsp:Transcript_22837/g.34277  ORF Transcript_22837/g.34277 Transcript_22837/m.34277 type:complete len:375 (+) Transcript_22837:72-1196(+)|eukprot:CAMPEP_0116010288 /NCGR_PEP_ID=MMETSP0321-20121206/3917_1 /TAXON_ID=163516 /ORGANISM="Leptocylindrus danicus var. danicus, Strain B650" /LENGTH=374 /DNA_ID=CAMNT_0003479369 /DNA_START=739 /DNA_END=1863 /DNA_ORIENTATION=+
MAEQEFRSDSEFGYSLRCFGTDSSITSKVDELESLDQQSDGTAENNVIGEGSDESSKRRDRSEPSDDDSYSLKDEAEDATSHPRISTRSTKPRRRRKVKGERMKVRHDYQDFSHVDDELFSLEHPKVMKRGGVVTPFPEKLHDMLEKIDGDNLAHVVSWQSHGRAFLVRDPKEFVKEVLPVYFRQSKITSFQRQLNLYGFRRITHGPDNGAYYHQLFLRGRPKLCQGMVRVKIKGTGTKAANNPEHEPNFYEMPPVGPCRSYALRPFMQMPSPMPGVVTTFMPRTKSGRVIHQHVFKPSPLSTKVATKEEKAPAPVSSRETPDDNLRNVFDPIDTDRSFDESKALQNDMISPTHPLDRFSFSLLDFNDGTPVAV